MLIYVRGFHRHIVAGTAVLFMLSLLCFPSVSATAETRFTIVDSSPTSWVARGYDNYTVTPDEWTFTPSRNFDNGVGFDIRGTAPAGTDVDYWFLNFAAPFNAQITPGFYDNFQRFPFQDADRPGLEFGSTGRLDNQASGFFEVFEASYSPAGDVLSFSADFTHYGETFISRYAVVQLRYNATVPAPSALITAFIGALPCTVLFLRRRRSRNGETQPSER